MAYDLKLAQIPQILSLIVNERLNQGADSITVNHQFSQVEKLMKQPDSSGRSRFAGDVAVAEGLATVQLRDAMLAKQCNMKIDAAGDDLARIIIAGSQSVPAWLKPAWGNAGVNASNDSPSLLDAQSAAANLAANLVLVVNEKRNELTEALSHSGDPLLPKLTAAVDAARKLSANYYGGSHASQEQLTAHATTLIEALQAVNAVSPIHPLDANGKPIILNDYLSARATELFAGIEQLTMRNQAVGRQS